MSNQYDLEYVPADRISSLQFSPDGTRLIVGSWDRSLYLYGRTAGDQWIFIQRIDTGTSILGVCWDGEGKHIFYVGLDHTVKMLEPAKMEEPKTEDIKMGEDAEAAEDPRVEEGAHAEEDAKAPTHIVLRAKTLSTHEKASNKVAFSAEHGLVFSTSFDGTMHVHDPTSGAFIRLLLAAKPFALSLDPQRVVVVMAERKVAVYELTALKALLEQNGSTESYQNKHAVKPWQERESSLKFQARAILCMPDATGFAISSIEGRVGVEFFDPEYNQEKKYAFKCHRQTETETDDEGNETEVDMVYCVNALAFHPVHGTFATGGGDGVVALWDAKTKRRVRQYQKLGASVLALDFSPDGKFLAIGLSPGFKDIMNEERVDSALVKVTIRELAEGEAKAKAAKQN